MSDNRKVNRLCNVLTVVCCLIRLLSERWGITLTWPHPDPLQQVERELPSRERRLLRRLRLLAMTSGVKGEEYEREGAHVEGEEIASALRASQ